MSDRAYVRDGAEIYRRSFAIIRAESDLAGFTATEEPVAVRIIHACGMTEVARDIVMSPGFAERARLQIEQRRCPRRRPAARDDRRGPWLPGQHPCLGLRQGLCALAAVGPGAGGQGRRLSPDPQGNDPRSGRAHDRHR